MIIMNHSILPTETHKYADYIKDTYNITGSRKIPILNKHLHHITSDLTSDIMKIIEIYSRYCYKMNDIEYILNDYTGENKDYKDLPEHKNIYLIRDYPNIKKKLLIFTILKIKIYLFSI